MSNVDTNVSTTADGFIVGVEPAATPASRFAQGTQDTGPVTQPPPQQGQTNGERTFTEAQVEEFRKQEKDKVYPRIESMAKELEELKNERDAARKAAEDAQAAAEAEAKAKAQDEMTVRDLLRQTQEQFQQEITSVRTEAEIAKAELEQERRLQQLRDYRSAALSANAALDPPRHRRLCGGGNTRTDRRIHSGCNRAFRADRSGRNGRSPASNPGDARSALHVPDWQRSSGGATGAEDDHARADPGDVTIGVRRTPGHLARRRASAVLRTALN